MTLVYQKNPDGTFSAIDDHQSTAQTPGPAASLSDMATKVGAPYAASLLPGGVGVGGLAAGGATAYESVNGIKEALNGQKLGLPEEAALALPTFGMSFLANSFLNHKTTAQYQQEADAAITADKTDPTGAAFLATRNAAAPGTSNYKGKVDTSIDPNFVGINPATGQWTNNKYASSHSLADLAPEDLTGQDSMFQKFGNDWLGKFSLDQRKQIAAAALKGNDVTSSKGMLNVNWTPDLQSQVDSITKAPSPSLGGSKLKEVSPVGLSNIDPNNVDPGHTLSADDLAKQMDAINKSVADAQGAAAKSSRKQATLDKVMQQQQQIGSPQSYSFNINNPYLKGL